MEQKIKLENKQLPNYPLVSVIIPVYNVLTYVAEAIESVIQQTYKNLEIIIIDDGSTDGSSQLCDEYMKKDSRIRVIHQNNQGLSGARNSGLNSMNGEIVSFLDSDDAFHPEMIQRMLEVMYCLHVDVVTCKDVSLCTDKRMEVPEITVNQITNKPVVYDRKEALKALIDEKISWHAWNKLYMRKLFESIRYPKGHVYEDVDTTFRIFDKCNQVAVIDIPLVMYRKRKGSITVDYSVDSAKDRDRAYGHVIEFVKENTPDIFSEELKQKICRRRLVGTLGTFARIGVKDLSYRKVVLDAASDVDLKKCDFQTKVKYSMFCHFPMVYIMVHLPLRRLKRQMEMLKNKTFLLSLNRRIEVYTG